MLNKILIIEDDSSIREDITEMFKMEGFDVSEATNGKTGIDKAFSILPDLIICDLTMPDMDGFEVKKHLNQNKKTAFIPFICLTARTDIKDVQRAMELGADDYISKPVRAKKLLELVSKRLQRIEDLKISSSPIHVNSTLISQDERVIFKSGEKHILAVLEDIVIIKSADDYSEVILKSGEKILIKKSLKSWEETLPEKSFLRIHRNTIINTKLIEKIEKMFNGSYVVRLKNYPDAIYFSQRYSQKIRKLLLIK